jgi:arylsulfatase A-like enzyme
MYPPDTLTLPNAREDDLDDVPAMGRAMARTHDHANVLKYDQWREAVQGYLASVTFADACVGRVLDALDGSPHAENTVVVLWSDHGWHLGEKLHWRKYALWEEATHNVLIFAGPGINRKGARCDAPVSLMDIYPTLNDLCRLMQRDVLEGDSLMPFLENPGADWGRPAVTTNGYNNHSVRSRHWRYTRYADGTEELYDHRHDPLEWSNLADEPACARLKRQLARWLPERNAPEDPPFPVGTYNWLRDPTRP